MNILRPLLRLRYGHFVIKLVLEPLCHRYFIVCSLLTESKTPSSICSINYNATLIMCIYVTQIALHVGDFTLYEVVAQDRQSFSWHQINITHSWFIQNIHWHFTMIFLVIFSHSSAVISTLNNKQTRLTSWNFIKMTRSWSQKDPYSWIQPLKWSRWVSTEAVMPVVYDSHIRLLSQISDSNILVAFIMLHSEFQIWRSFFRNCTLWMPLRVRSRIKLRI